MNQLRAALPWCRVTRLGHKLAQTLTTTAIAQRIWQRTIRIDAIRLLFRADGAQDHFGKEHIVQMGVQGQLVRHATTTILLIFKPLLFFFLLLDNLEV